MIRRLFLVGFLVFVVLPAALLTFEHVQGKRELTALLEGYRARGEVLDLGRLIPPVPTPKSNGLPALVTATERLQNLSQRVPPAFFTVAPGRAVSSLALDSWPTERGSTNPWPDLESLLANHGPELELLHTALEYPVRRPELDWQKGMHMLLPHLPKYKAAVVALSACAADSARRGDLDQTILELQAMGVLERDLEVDPLLIGQLVRIACSSIASSRFWSIAQARDWSEPELARLQQALPPSDLGPGVVHSIEGERAMALLELRRISATDFEGIQAGAMAFGTSTSPLQVPESVDQAVEMASTLVQRLANGVGAKLVFPVWQFGWGDQAIAQYLRCIDELLRIERQSVQARSLDETKKLDFAGMVVTNTISGRLRGLYSRMMVPALENSLSKALRTDTERDLHLTGIALRRFQLRHGRLPAQLEQLVPEFLPAVPTDRMDGRPLRYRLEPDGTFVLWSVGEDLVDQGGDATPNSDSSGNLYWWRCRDAVWPRRASETEIAAWRSAEERKLARRNQRATTTGTFAMSPELMKRYGLLPRTAGATPDAPNTPNTTNTNADAAPPKP